MLLVEASSALLASPQTSDVLRTIIDLAHRFGSADAYAVWRKLNERGEWGLVSSEGLSRDFVQNTATEGPDGASLPKSPMAFEDVDKQLFLARRHGALHAEGIRSMMVVPLHMHGTASGTVVFYWKTPHKFTESEIRIASALGNMAAAALGTSELYEREKELRKQAQLSEQRAAFLAEAGAALASSLDYEVTLKSVARLAVAAFADWCSVDVARDGSLERVAIEHLDPAKIQLARAYREKYPISQDDASQQVFRTGKPFLMEAVPQELIVQRVRDADQLKMILQMGIASIMVVPMIHRERSLGVITFVSSNANRTYTGADLALAEELARRAAIAIDNASLFTESKAAQASLRVVNSELRRANEDLNQFAYSVSHDLQEPMRMISAYVQLLQKRYRNKLDDDADRFINFAVQGAQRMEALLRDILAYTQSIDTQPKHCDPIELDEIMRTVLSNLRQAIEASRATVTVDPLPKIAAAQVHMLQLFQNLIGNALKYAGKSSPQVHVSATREDGDWLFSVRDNGIGIDPQYKEQIFGLFRRLHRHDEYEGTGVGLAICQKIVERYGGRIWVESDVGKGADFRFTLPDSTGQPAK